MKNKAFLAILVVGFIGCGPSEKENKVSEKEIQVSISEVKTEKVVTNLKYSGTVEASQTIPLTFQSIGTVEKVLVEAGDEVKKGQLLATIETSNTQSMYDLALSKYNQAKDAFDRLKTVHDQGSLPEIKWVEMETTLEQAKSSLEISKNNLDKCYMRAPVSGIIGKRNVEPGMSAVFINGSPLEIVEITQVNIKIAVPENEISKIKKGIVASFTLSALDNKIFEGKVKNISPVADQISRTYEVKILVNNPNMELNPGMVCDVTLGIKSEKDVTVIPYQSVANDKDGNAFVYVVNKKDNHVKKQLVKTGDYRDNNLEILQGLTQGQVIVSEGKEKLSNNSIISL
jgi:RND family efflux transporter MFP subunit